MSPLFQKKRVLVIGDLILDVYTMGQVKRISPEAPVPVLQVSHEKHLPGGAGNVILNLVSLGMEVIAVGRVGDDEDGRLFLQAMASENVETKGIIYDPTFKTTVKNRMIAEGQQIARIDYEKTSPLNSIQERAVVEMLPRLLQEVDAIAVSDYAKGFLTSSLLRFAIEKASSLGIPVLVDPKGVDFYRYRGATILKPNLAEAILAAKLEEEATLDEIAEMLLKNLDVQFLMITRSKEGISLFSKQGQRQDFPTEVHEIKDVTGAGDTVLAVITAAVANQLDLSVAAELANIGAGKVINHIGCAQVTPADLEVARGLV